MRKNTKTRPVLNFDAEAYGLKAPNNLSTRQVERLNKINGEGYPSGTIKSLVAHYNYTNSPESPKFEILLLSTSQNYGGKRIYSTVPKEPDNE